MTSWMKRVITCNDFNGGRFEVTVVFPPKFQEYVEIETAAIHSQYISLESFKKDLLPIICNNEGRLVNSAYIPKRLGYIDSQNNKTNYLNGAVNTY
ncbi:conserved hypothetical protein [Photobacterium leiognathi lrivu.4.1]|uniref:Uncharacterized protein n=1 Tax=Photobacterium leiognathi lrivu.4.1 TaxID=1248232 RepID=V5F6J5_PHOLE|nr:hypothetical protein [Photobacterium leiognathi]GAD31673.1 conserved hypothetical protein [Photobacterium leiognathi lrivu.4.1]